MLEGLFWMAAAAYGLSFGLIMRNYLSREPQPAPHVWWLVLLGAAAQGAALVGGLRRDGGLMAVNLAASLESTALAMGLLYLVGWRLRREEIRAVGLLVLPLMMLLLVASQLMPAGGPGPREVANPLLIGHLVSSLLAYGLFTLALALALLESFQEHALRFKEFGRWFAMLPPLGALEERMFRLLRPAMALLTISIVTGAIYSHQRLGIWIALTHKVIFTWATWVLFGVLLLGHRYQGWRGRRAVRFTVVGYLMLVLAYLGVKVVSELILHKQ
ncbi:MAG: cytochrome c biogenesis protein CcsA [Magnetococcales bacterium]|nr:cytochrome c biogenesis protein CcsA [Magnetococcales bacterium]